LLQGAVLCVWCFRVCAVYICAPAVQTKKQGLEKQGLNPNPVLREQPPDVMVLCDSVWCDSGLSVWL